MVFKSFIEKINRHSLARLSDGMVVYIRYAWFDDLKNQFVRYVVPLYDDWGNLV